MIARSQIVEAGRSWVGTPYKHQGRRKGPHGGIDCLGFIWGVAREVGFAVQLPANYTEHPNGVQLIAGCDDQLVKPERTSLAPGDIAIFFGWSRDEPSHYALIASVPGESPTRLTMIHAFSKRQQVVEHGLDDFWMKRFVTFYEFPGTEPV